MGFTQNRSMTINYSPAKMASGKFVSLGNLSLKQPPAKRDSEIEGLMAQLRSADQKKLLELFLQNFKTNPGRSFLLTDKTVKLNL